MKRLIELLRWLAQAFLAGTFVILPLVVTVAVVVWLVGLLASVLGPTTVTGRLLASLGLQVVSSEAFAYLIGWTVVLSAVFGLGLLVQMGARRFVEERMDGLARRVPLIGGVYGTVRQLVGMMDRKHGADLKGMSVVFCIFGKETGAAFLALLPTPEVFRIGEVDYHAVLVPTAPVPVGGSLIFVPRDSVRPSNLSIDAFMSVYVSMGVTGPQFLASGPPGDEVDQGGSC